MGSISAVRVSRSLLLLQCLEGSALRIRSTEVLAMHSKLFGVKLLIAIATFNLTSSSCFTIFHFKHLVGGQYDIRLCKLGKRVIMTRISVVNSHK